MIDKLFLGKIYIVIFLVVNTLDFAVGQSTSPIQLELDYRYELEEGFYHSFLEYEEGMLYSVCPNLQRIYSIDTEEREINFFTFNQGRGPNEVFRGPFGISISKDELILGDLDLRRMITMSHRGEPNETVLFDKGSNVGTIYNISGEEEFLIKVQNTALGIRYVKYDPNTKKEELRYNLPEKDSKAFRFSGFVALTDKYLVHINTYYGDMMVWERNTGSYLKTIQVLNPGNPKPISARMGEFVGSIPPQDLEEKFVNISDNPLDPNRVFLIVDSKNGKYQTETVYEYDLVEEEMVGKYKLDIPAKLIQNSETHLFVYSEASDVIYQYEIKKIQ
ncbi:hypothetical protein [Gracilimonas mengyeensis]|uniref:TolB-like 6-blade propeller-like n=1 Tax=Gracilimonas mengyeensis TaxID=1302730 RepID=A0A521BYS4_9BACT|nr:hypothetical protein [Gracilimonas mengyeensis]SMO52339.1 hypothetical protein SAMN06265219_10413 [Gracilimonas mengyeensis]